MNRQALMAIAHHRSVLARRVDDETLRVPVDDQRMVARGCERGGQALEQPAAPKKATAKKTAAKKAPAKKAAAKPADKATDAQAAAKAATKRLSRKAAALR